MLSERYIKCGNQIRGDSAARQNIEKGEEEDMACCKTKSTPENLRGAQIKANCEGDLKNIVRVYRSQV